MQVLLITDSYIPNRTSVARMIHELAHELVRTGHKVTIVTSTRDIAVPIHVDECVGIRICRVRAGKGDHIGRVSRAFAELALPFVVWRLARAEIAKAAPDIVVSYSPTIFWGWLVGRIKRTHKCQAYLILRDIFPQWPYYGTLHEQDVVLERRSATTYGNAQQSLPLVEAMHCRSLVLITSHLHMRRAFKTFRQVFPREMAIVTRSVSSGAVPARVGDLTTETLKAMFYSLWAY